MFFIYWTKKKGQPFPYQDTTPVYGGWQGHGQNQGGQVQVPMGRDLLQAPTMTHTQSGHQRSTTPHMMTNDDNIQNVANVANVGNVGNVHMGASTDDMYRNRGGGSGGNYNPNQNQSQQGQTPRHGHSRQSRTGSNGGNSNSSNQNARQNMYEAAQAAQAAQVAQMQAQQQQQQQQQQQMSMSKIRDNVGNRSASSNMFGLGAPSEGATSTTNVSATGGGGAGGGGSNGNNNNNNNKQQTGSSFAQSGNLFQSGYGGTNNNTTNPYSQQSQSQSQSQNQGQSQNNNRSSTQQSQQSQQQQQSSTGVTHHTPRMSANGMTNSLNKMGSMSMSGIGNVSMSSIPSMQAQNSGSSSIYNPTGLNNSDMSLPPLIPSGLHVSSSLGATPSSSHHSQRRHLTHSLTPHASDSRHSKHRAHSQSSSGLLQMMNDHNDIAGMCFDF